MRISRTVDVDAQRGSGRWLDTFTNTTREELTVEVAFGGQTGYGATGTTASRVAVTSSGDTTTTADDTWAATTSGTAEDATTTTGGPSATVVGDFDRTGNWLRETFTQPMGTEGHAANFPAYVNTLTLAPGQSASLLHFVVVGEPVTAQSADTELAEVSEVAADLADAPDLEGLTRQQICSIVNFEHLSPADAGVEPDHCRGKGATRVQQPEAPEEPAAVTTSAYDVVDKTIAELQTDMETGRTTSVEITQAYLDRIAAYDEGQFAFNAFTTVADDALWQAAAAGLRRANGERGALLGVPIAVKDLYDTRDMPTTNGSSTFEGFQPAEDAYQVAQLREAGAVIIGKASMEEYATSGSYSDSAYGSVWNAFDPSRSALASSGGSAVATATSMAAAGLGSQTGDSLYAPATAASLVTLRGTDGMQSDRGVMPLVWLQDYAGTMTRSVSDPADILNVTSGTDPENPETAEADEHRPADWRSTLDDAALQGKRIGILPEVWQDPYGTTTTIEASRAALEHLRVAGAEVAAWRGYRAQYQANIDAWMDQHGLDAVVYPGLLSEISLDDGGGNRSSFGRRDTPSGGSGVPTVAFPAGTDANGAPISLQLMGRAWDDAELVAMAYAFEQVADGHVAPDTAPALAPAGTTQP
ncbi:amidase [Kineococcus arenarius]|uniref:amidase n=1 Tax=unclassified Kineococcus TaxID=2621656 RepID=UPI003D7CBD14